MDEKKETCHCKRCNRNLPKEDFFENRKHWAQCNICRAKKLASRKIWNEKNKDKFQCKDCDSKFPSNCELKQHTKGVHLKIKDHECKNCEFKSSTKGDLQAHIKAVHLKIKDFECNDCDYKCSKNRDLQIHIRICTGILNISSGEFAVKNTLDEMEIKYDHNSSYELKNVEDKWLRWDFIIQTDAGPIFIEYDGKQHFEPVRFGNLSQEKAEIAFQKGKAHDKLKNDYCSENDNPLLRIPYTQFGNVKQLVTKFICEHTDWGCE